MLSTTWTNRMGLALVLLALTATPATAQGWIEPGVDRSGITVLKTRSDVRVRVEGRVARIEVSEWFVNRGARLAEGEYLYPLPGEAVFQGFSLFQGDAELRGEIMDAERAREIYEAIVRRRADPALIEMAGQGLLRARVFPIQPGEERRVTLRYTQVLERAGDALQLLYAGGVRGGPGVGTAAGDDGRRTTLPVSTDVTSSFVVQIEDGSRFLDPFSPTHGLSVDRDGGELTVRLEEAMAGRLSLFLPFSGPAVGMSVATHRPPGEDGYFMLMLSPDHDAGTAQPRDLTVVLDVSGSMSGEKIEQARSALHQLLSTLSREDRFRLIAFSNAVHRHSADWARGSRAEIERARAWVDRLVADGGTNIEAALGEAFRLRSPEERLPVVIFLTDGLPSVGEQSPERLADRAEASAGRARVFAFGVGHDVNTHLLDRLGEAGRGATDYVQPGENVERVVALLATKIRHPVLTDLESFSGGPMGVGEIYPVRIPDLFAGEELVLFGRFEGDGQGQMTVTGRRLNEGVEFATELRFPEASEANAYIPRLWAARKLGHLERQLWTEGETRSLVDEIRTLALRFGLPSRYTSYLVEEPTLVAADPGTPTRDAGFLNRLFSGRGSSAPAAPEAASGAEAVKAAQAARSRRETSSAADISAAEDRLQRQLEARADAAAPMTTLGGRLFRLQNGVWTDVTHPEGRRVVAVRAFGDAYFALLNALPELRPVLRELDAVLLAGAQVGLRIGEDGLEEMSTSELRELVEDFRGGTGAR